MAPGNKYSDEELLSLVRDGDEHAFDILYKRYWKTLLLQAFIKLDSAQPAEEVVQTVFINLWRRRAMIELKYSFRTYIAAALKYEILREQARRRKERSRNAANQHLYVVEDNSTAEWLSYEQLRDNIENEVNHLPEKCQLVFRLSREQGLSEKEIAQSLNISPKTVQAHMGKALKQLRSSLRQLLWF